MNSMPLSRLGGADNYGGHKGANEHTLSIKVDTETRSDRVETIKVSRAFVGTSYLTVDLATIPFSALVLTLTSGLVTHSKRLQCDESSPL